MSTDDGLVKEGVEIGHRFDEVQRDLARVAIAYGVERTAEFASKIGILKTAVNHAVQQAMKSGTTMSARRTEAVKRGRAVG